MKVLLDTCIIVDALQSREPFAENAQHIFLAAASGQCEAFITAKEVTDIYYLMHHALHNKEKTQQLMGRLFVLFQIIDTKAEDVRQALAFSLSDYEDAVMVQSAAREGLDGIVTRNLKDYKNASFPVYSPEEFLRIIHYQEP